MASEPSNNPMNRSCDYTEEYDYSDAPGDERKQAGQLLEAMATSCLDFEPKETVVAENWWDLLNQSASCEIFASPQMVATRAAVVNGDMKAFKLSSFVNLIGN